MNLTVNGKFGLLGRSIIETPAIDRLAAMGCFFTNFYSGAMFVRLPALLLWLGYILATHAYKKAILKCSLKGNVHARFGSHDCFLNLCKRLAKRKRGAFGKWGLGFPGSERPTPAIRGFDQFFGYKLASVMPRSVITDHPRLFVG